MNRKPRILFLCSKNQWRSPTAARMYLNDPRIDVRSAGLTASAKRRVSTSDLEWANLVLVMEQEHKIRLQENFKLPPGLAIGVLDIPDEYQLMDPTLMDLIRDRVETIISDLIKPRSEKDS